VKSGGISILLAALLIAALNQHARAEERVNVARSGIDIAFAPIEVGREAHIWSDRGLALGYVMNKMHVVSNIGPRIMRLIEAVYACV